MEVVVGGLEWLLAQARPAPGDAAWWPTTEGGDEPDPTLYSGTAGVALTFVEAYGALGDDRWAGAALRGGRYLAHEVNRWPDSSLFFGIAGMAFALHEIGERLDDPVCRAAVPRALAALRHRYDGERWNPMSELLFGNAGVALAALRIGDLDLATLALDLYRHTADPTPAGVNWAVRPSPARSHHLAHGTLGIVLALAEVGAATDRADLLDLAVAGADDVVSRNEAGPDGFLVPHSDPPHRPELIERYSYGWCNGPAGDAQVFRRLHAVTGDPRWAALADRCWHTVTTSGLPARLRPGFWDNNGRCCGTAGVLALATDRLADRPPDGPPDDAFGQDLVDDLRRHATIDEQGVRWSNVEHRADPSLLPAATGWAMGSAGILRELLRRDRVAAGESTSYVVPWPGERARGRVEPPGQMDSDIRMGTEVRCGDE